MADRSVFRPTQNQLQLFTPLGSEPSLGGVDQCDWAPPTCTIDGAGMNLTVVTPASSQCAAALLQGDMAGEHTLAQVLIVQIIVALLTLHRRR